jgi:prepilin-type N-terminal cleavage/methylation domain-containing protein
MNRAHHRSGFTLVEVMVVLTVIAIFAALCVPSYQRAVEQSRADIAAANLRTIWAAQRLYWLEYQSYTPNLSNLRSLGLVDPEVAASTTSYVYSIDSATSSAFTAVAARSGSGVWTGELSIDQTGLITGTISGAGQAAITPGFQ